MKIITIEDLENKGACKSGIKIYKQLNLESKDWDNLEDGNFNIDCKYEDYTEWLFVRFNISGRINDRIEYEYDANNNLLYRKYYDGSWIKREYDTNNNIIYHEDSCKHWYRYEFDANGYEIYYEDSDGRRWRWMEK
jgi:hypothetical protein